MSDLSIILAAIVAVLLSVFYAWACNACKDNASIRPLLGIDEGYSESPPRIA